jgi:hypothetical protein
VKNIVIATPSYKDKVTVPYMGSIIDYLNSKKFRVMYNIYPGDSLVARARNALFSNIVNNINDFDYIIWQDDDVSATKEGIERIISLGHDVIALATPLRYPPSQYGIRCAVMGVYEDCGNMLYKADFAGFGFFAMSRKACFDIVNYCENNNDWYMDRNNKVYDICKVGVNSAHIYESEDFYTCSLLRKLGYEIYVDSSTPVSHAQALRNPMPINSLSIQRKYTEINNTQRWDVWTPNDWETSGPLY